MLTRTIRKILLAGLLSTAVLIPVAAQINLNTIEDRITAECAFPDLELPDEFVVYVAGGDSSRPLDFQIDQSGLLATQIDLMVNSPSKPVVLLLGTGNPNIWNIKWTEGTDIVAVVATGYHTQKVAGLPEQTPILTSTRANGAKCGNFNIGLNKEGYEYTYEYINPLSQRLFGQSIEEINEVKGSYEWIGEPKKDEDLKLISSNDTTVDSFFDPTAPLAGVPGLEQAVEQGILRRATEEDAEAWMELQQKLHPGKDVSRPIVDEFAKAYVILDRFTYPNGVFGGTFFIPSDVPEPSGNPGLSSVYNFKTGKCTSVGAPC